MKFTCSIALGLGVLFLAGCSAKDAVTDAVEDGGIGDLAHPPRVVIDDHPANWGTDWYRLEAAAIEGGTLTLTVTYGGGCRSHGFVLVASETFVDSTPVQLITSLAHEANDDPCQAAPTKMLAFDLSPIRTHYVNTFDEQTGSVVLLLRGSPSGNLVYEFN